MTQLSKITLGSLEKLLSDLRSQQPTVERLQRLKVIRNGTDVDVFGLKPTVKHSFLMFSNIQRLYEGTKFR